MLRTLLGALLSAAALLCAPAASAQQIVQLTMASSHPTSYLPTGVMASHMRAEVDRLLKEGGGKYAVRWKESYGGSLYKMQDSMEAVRDGLVDIGIVFALFESDTMPLSNVSYYTPFASGKMAAVMDAMDELVRTNPAVRAEWEHNGMTFLAPIAAETYGLWTNFPVRRLADLKGRKINTPGVASKWLQGTGAVAVDGGLPTYFTNVQTGVTEGAMSFYTGILGTRLYEVAPYIADADIGVAAFGGVAANTQRLRSLPQPVRDAILKAGASYKEALVKETLGRVAAARQDMLAKGAKALAWSDADRRAWAEAMPDVAGEWVRANAARKLPAAAVLKQYMASLRAAGEKPLRAWGE